LRVLLIGSGGREHALAWRLAPSRRVAKLFVSPGNGGTATIAENVPLPDHAAIVGFAKEQKIDYVVIGPDPPLVAGLADDLRAAGLRTFGPSKAAAQLEGSKSFTKALCDRFHIPTAAYRRFDLGSEADAYHYIRDAAYPLVIKADGLMAGKGVTIAQTLTQAGDAIRTVINDGPVVIEEFLEGEEASFFTLVRDDGSLVVLPTAQDHKRALDGDEGPNTGGMGAYSPAPVMTDAQMERTQREVIAPTIAGMAELGMPFSGVLYTGLMVTADGPKVIEHNVRFGDPECQVLMMRLQSDLVDLLLGEGEPAFSDDVALTVVMATKGYPGAYGKGSEITRADDYNSDNVHVFHAGTKRDGGRLLATGGRVLNVTALGKTVSEASARAYQTIAAIDWPDGFYRRDIGWRAIARERG
jgi:phosphoribosylamine--glycine ligase